MSDDIEVTVTLPKAEAMEWASGDISPTYYPSIQEACRKALGVRITPPRSEYPLQHVTESAGCTSVADLGVVLVPAHSLRSGDEVEWAPQDWRAIESVNSVETDVAVGWHHTREVVHFWPFELVAVRRGVTG